MRRIADGNCLFFRDASLAALADSYCNKIEIVHTAGVLGADAHSVSTVVSCARDTGGWNTSGDAGLRTAAPRGGHPVGLQEIYEYEALGGGSGRRLHCRLTSFSRSLQINLRTNLDGTGHYTAFSTSDDDSSSTPALKPECNSHFYCRAPKRKPADFWAKEKSFRFPGRTSLALRGISLLSLCVFAFPCAG